MKSAEPFSLKYGNSALTFDIPESVNRFEFTEPECNVDHDKFVSGLRKSLNGKDATGQVAVVVADKTRLCGYARILPWVVEVLQEMGAEKDRIVFFIAYGTHPRQSDQECLNGYGEVYNEYAFVHHDCTDAEFVCLGETQRNTIVSVRKDLLESSLILTVGAVSHHYFAGYGGGRKLIFPGLAERSAIYANHRLFLDREKGGLAAGCQPGKLEGNPLGDDLKDIDDLLPCYSSIHAVLGSDGQPAQYYFGNSYQDFISVCAILDGCYKVSTTERYDLVIASAGGYPKDINFIQVHKSIHHAATLVRDGGMLILLAECVDGVGSETFLPYFKMGGWQPTFSHLAVDYAGNGGTALAMMQKAERIGILLVTDLDDAVCRLIGVEKISPAEAQKKISNHAGSLALVENSSMLVVEHLEDMGKK